MTLVGVEEAAERLGVSVRQVQRLARAGDLVSVGLNRLDWESVLQQETVRQGHHGRAWSEPTAWAAIALVAGLSAEWLGQAQRSRLKAHLRQMADTDLVARTRNRADVRRVRGHRAAVGRIAAEIVVSGSSRTIGDLTAASSDRVDGYVTDDQYAQLVARYRLDESAGSSANVILRVTGFDLGKVAEIAQSGGVLAALDLGTSLDVRERSAGLAILAERLKALR